MYIKIQQLKKRLKKIPELQAHRLEKATKFSQLLNLIMDESYVTEEIRKIPREDLLWVRGLLIDYINSDIKDEEFWAAVYDTMFAQRTITKIKNILASLPSMEVNQYV